MPWLQSLNEPNQTPNISGGWHAHPYSNRKVLVDCTALACAYVFCVYAWAMHAIYVALYVYEPMRARYLVDACPTYPPISGLGPTWRHWILAEWCLIFKVYRIGDLQFIWNCIHMICCYECYIYVTRGLLDFVCPRICGLLYPCPLFVFMQHSVLLIPFLD